MPTDDRSLTTSRIAHALFPQVRSSVLAELVTASQEGLHLREIARRAGLNSKTVMRELHSQRDAGILVSKKVGNQVIYRLNPECPIYDELRSIIRKTVGLAGVLREALEPLANRIQLAYVYGSHARGEVRSDSDVDFMVVGDVSLREISPAIRTAGRMLRRVVNPTLYVPDEYAAELRVEDSFVSRVHNGLRVDVIGGSA
ncbi:nucleotidyltransferase domain-containing protein [Candidatus Bipolaricaulota bacterium]|nr:nucleotidyltransferase domain-containing protein [Candidatus Bipolaricaulota bacterium]